MTAVSSRVSPHLSMLQQHMLLSERLGRPQASHLTCVVLGLVGSLQVDSLRRALTRIVERHEILRTGVRMEDGMPTAEVRSAAGLELTVEPHAATQLTSSDELDAILRSEFGRPMDLHRGLPIRARLLHCPDMSILLATVHHIAFDEWSRQIFCDELSVLYNAFRAGRSDPLPPPAVTYHDIVALRQRRLAQDGAELLAYWQDRLAGLRSCSLPTDHPRPPKRAGAGAAVRRVIGQADVDRLAATGQAATASLATVLFAACQVLIRLRTGTDDVTVGTTWAAREDAGAESVIGPLVNLVVLRGDISGDPTFADLVTRFSDVALAAYDQSAVPFEQLVERLADGRDPSRTPLFQILVEYVDSTRPPPQLDGMAVSVLPVPCTTSKYDLGFWFEHSQDGSLALEIVWDTSLYSAETAAELADQLARLLAFLAANPRARISDLPVPALAASAGLHQENGLPAPRSGGTPDSTPLTAVQEGLSAIWADVLDRTPPGVDDDFFVLGGHSLLIIRVANRIRDQFEIDVPLSMLFEHTTLSEQAAQIEQLAATTG